ncbi:EamA family transporter [Candidatus Woesearchaeota archaeon]|nr:EamA family transporter [Candidatus Woesearchaeota archaeon]
MNLKLALTLILISSIVGAFSTLLFKMGASYKINFENKRLLGAVFLSGISFVIYIYALKQAPLTFIYLTASVSYIWVVILARTILKEEINKLKFMGIVLVITGIILIQV